MAVALGLGALPAAQATEGSFGRPITGMQVNPYAGIVPPEPGLNLTFSSIYYDGSIKNGRQSPVVGQLSSDLKYQISYNLLNAVYVWDTGPGRWNFASGLGLPYQYTDMSASLNRLRKQDSSTDMADLLLIPIVASYHISQTEHLALGLQAYAPTGSFDKNRLANAGQNDWTFIPTLSYTKLFENNVELSANWGMQFYTPNSDTGYHSGVLNTVDALVLKRFGAWGVGLAAGWIQQLTDDKGTLADALNGNRGYSLGAGPMLTWQGKAGTTPVSASLRWVNEFEARNRPKGNAVMGSVGASF